MDPAEYANLEKIEATHWYYAGKRELVGGWVRCLREGEAKPRLLDCGAGTGRFAEEMTRDHDVWVLDDHEESLQMLRRRFPTDRVLALSESGVPLPDRSLDVITALDVLEHVPDDVAVVNGFRRLLRPGGLVVVTVPASMSLWSEWDVALHHYRRYHRRGLQALFPAAEWETLHVNYTNVLAYPVVWGLRRWQRWRAKRGGMANTRFEDRVPATWINRILRWVFVATGRSRIPWPFGVSLILVARRR